MDLSSETAELLSELRRRGAEPSNLEVKAAASGTPKSLRETFSAFSNGHGGMILLGLQDDDDFTPVPDFDADSIRDGVAGMAANDMTPPVRCSIDIDEVDGARLVRVDIPEMERTGKPCFVSARGAYNGSYVRGGDGDRRLTHYEVTQLLLNHGQPTFDLEAVVSSSVDDLDPAAVAALVDRVRERQPRAFPGDTERVLRQLKVLVETEGRLVPSIAGLLTLGVYPQQFFPQLFVSFVALPGLSMGAALPDGTRFLDNVTCDGPIPLMLETAVAAARRNMTRAAVIHGIGREDRLEYPIDVVRELLVNAIMHRDYSPESRGAQVQVELYPDRLVVKNPGGLFGPIDEAQFGAPGLTSSRNPVLASVLSEIPMPGTQHTVCENRGSGIPTMLTALRTAGMSPPHFDMEIANTRVTVPRHGLLDDTTLSWLSTLNLDGLGDQHRVALAMMREGQTVNNEMLREWGMHRADATTVLSELVQRGLATRGGGRRYAVYRLAEEPPLTQPALDFGEPGGAKDIGITTLNAELTRVLDLVARHNVTTTKSLQDAESWSYSQALARLNRLIAAGLIEATASPTSKKRRYRATGSGLQALRSAPQLRP